MNAERACNFKPHEIPGLLDGSRTQFRRVMKPQPEDGVVTTSHHQSWDHSVCVQGTKIARTKAKMTMNGGCPFATKQLIETNPLGRPGDVIWGREAFKAFMGSDCRIEYKAGGVGFEGDLQKCSTIPMSTTECEEVFSGDNPDFTPRWRSGAVMPRWASRIILEIVSVRVERLQEISKEDAIAEGCKGGHGSIPGYGFSAMPYEHFKHVWNTYAKPGEDWDANPWVWVYEIKTQKAGNQ